MACLAALLVTAFVPVMFFPVFLPVSAFGLFLHLGCSFLRVFDDGVFGPEGFAALAEVVGVEFECGLVGGLLRLSTLGTRGAAE